MPEQPTPLPPFPSLDDGKAEARTAIRPTTPEHIHPNQWITIIGPNLGAKDISEFCDDPDMAPDGTTTVHICPSDSVLRLMGMPIQVKSVMAPFLFCAVFNLKGEDPRGLILDTRSYLVAPCSNHWKNTLFSFKPLHPPTRPKDPRNLVVFPPNRGRPT